MVIVVQLFAADHDAPGHDVAAGILAREVTVAPVVAQTVDDPGRSDRDPGHLHRPDRQPDRAAEDEVDHQHQADALPAEAAVHIALEPVVRSSGAVFFERFSVGRFHSV